MSVLPAAVTVAAMVLLPPVGLRLETLAVAQPREEPTPAAGEWVEEMPPAVEPPVGAKPPVEGD
ncbi:MAG: hypothetical protein JW751_03900 [Polyangiaceae bacterium]|nr:hypothetical protein [Polyangiaceae bacterium]